MGCRKACICGGRCSESCYEAERYCGEAEDLFHVALRENTALSAREIAEKALHIAADICVFTNHNVIVEEV